MCLLYFNFDNAKIEEKNFNKQIYFSNKFIYAIKKLLKAFVGKDFRL